MAKTTDKLVEIKRLLDKAVELSKTESERQGFLTSVFRAVDYQSTVLGQHIFRIDDYEAEQETVRKRQAAEVEARRKADPAVGTGVVAEILKMKDKELDAAVAEQNKSLPADKQLKFTEGATREEKAKALARAAGYQVDAPAQQQTQTDGAVGGS